MKICPATIYITNKFRERGFHYAESSKSFSTGLPLGRSNRSKSGRGGLIWKTVKALIYLVGLPMVLNMNTML